MLDRVCEAGGWIGHYGEYGSVPATRADTAAFTGSWIETVQHFLDLHPTVLDDDLPDQFPDLGAWTRSRRAINSLAVEGVITGYPDGTFKPGRIVTRARAATILVRAMDWLRGQGLNVERAQVKYGCDFPDANAPS